MACALMAPAEPMLIYPQKGPVAFTWEQFHSVFQATILCNEFENSIF